MSRLINKGSFPYHKTSMQSKKAYILILCLQTLLDMSPKYGLKICQLVLLGNMELHVISFLPFCHQRFNIFSNQRFNIKSQ